MSSAHLQLAAKGQEDRWLSESPDRTYFEAKYQPRINRSRETFEVPLDNQVKTFGVTGRCTIPVKGDYLTRLTLRAVFPPIYPTVAGEYVYPTPSSQVDGSVYANMGLTLVVADGVTLTANTVGNHYMSVGATVTLSGTAYRIFDLDGTYTVTSIPTAKSFTCSTALAGISYNGTMSFVGIACGDIISYFSTRSSNLWVNNLTNKTWQITGGSNVGTQWTFTTSAPSNFPVGSQIVLNLPLSLVQDKKFTVAASTDTTFTCIDLPQAFVSADRNDTNFNQQYSNDNGQTWKIANNTITGFWNSPIAFGHNTFIIISNYYGSTQLYSHDFGLSWTEAKPSLVGTWYGVEYGNGVFVMVGENNQAYSLDYGVSWTTVASPLAGDWYRVAYGNGVFVMVGASLQAYSTNNGLTWTAVTVPLAGNWFGVTYGNGVFVMIGQNYNTIGARSLDYGISWISATIPPANGGLVTFGNGVFVTAFFYSNDNGDTWNPCTNPPSGTTNIVYGNGIFLTTWNDYYNNVFKATSTDGISWVQTSSTARGFLGFGEFSYFNSPSDSVSLVNPPLQLTNRVFSSDVYPSISFANASDAAFWGFDARNGLTYSLTATPPWTLTQSGWVSGFLPPSTSTWDDSVAHKLVREARILVGKQTIKEYTGEYIELQNDLTVPYENKAILKLLNGTLDQTQATTAREYYTTLPLGTKEIPLCALTHQQMSVEVDFEAFTNLSQNLNPGTGDFLNPQSYLTYDASTGLLNGQPVNVQTTFSYQQYIFIVTYGGQFIVYDTTKDVADPTSYIVLSAFSGTSLFSQFCVLSGTLYIGLSNGKLLSIIIDELIQGNTSSSILNNYAPTIGTLTGTVVADFRYLYYTVSNTASSNVFLTRYDTTGSFTSPGSYTTVDFTGTFNSSVTGVYQTLSTGTELIMLPQGAPGTMYTYQLNANVQSQWYVLDYSSYGGQITEGVLIGNDLYFVIDDLNILKYSNSVFTINSVFTYTFIAFNQFTGSYAFSNNKGNTWIYRPVPAPYSGWYRSAPGGYGNFVAVGAFGGNPSYSFDNGQTWTVSGASGQWRGICYGKGVFVIVDLFGTISYSTDNGITWQDSAPISGNWLTPIFGNDVFVVVGYEQIYSVDNGITWNYADIQLSGVWNSVSFGNGVFVMVANNKQAYSTNNGLTWTAVTVPLAGNWFSVTYGGGVFVMIGINNQAYSTDNGLSWYYATGQLSGNWYKVTYGDGVFIMVDAGNGLVASSSTNGESWNVVSSLASTGWVDVCSGLPLETLGDGLRNLIAVGNYIYCSTSNVAVQIDTTQDLSTAAAYKFPAPVLPDGQYVFANGPRYIYMFSHSDSLAQNIVRFDPYPPTPTLQTSILVDYESLPPEVPKPDKALLGLVQTQKVTDMNYMNIRGPVKELWVTGVSSTTNVFQYSNLADQSTLALTAGEEIITEDVGTRTFLNTIEPFETHTSMPIRNVSVIPFELDPESDIPNGTVNFSRIRDQVFNGGAETVWARTYNLLAIQGGIGGLIFNS
jgi:hypothetical protein